MRSVHIIGSGFAGLSAACFMARAGWDVTVLEKLPEPGGRARQLTIQGFQFDMGPSWYWMPDIFDRFFKEFGKNTSDFYQLKRLDPSYRVYWENGVTDVPAGRESLRKLFDSIEPGTGERLRQFLKEAAEKYREGMKMAYQPGLSVNEFLRLSMLKAALKLDLFSSVKKHIDRSFKNEKLRMLLAFPSLFLGALPQNTPAMYSLMNYADMELGTWYPKGGLAKVAESIYDLAVSLGVQFKFDEPVERFTIEDNQIRSIHSSKAVYQTEQVISGADYHYIESLLSKPFQSYSAAYWNKRKMAPSCLLYYVGLSKKIEGLQHHTLFFDESFDLHSHNLYDVPKWPERPLFYMNAPSVTDSNVCPPGCENLFLLIPVSAGLTGDNEELRESYFQMILKRIEAKTGQNISGSIVVKKTFAGSDFENLYNSFKGNAYGLANTLSQTALFKPSCRSKKLNNLFYCGQLTVPGPGVPPALISGEIAAREVLKSNTVKSIVHDFHFS